MCIASLHASTQPCAHRWYQLVQPCNSHTNLQTCPNKLKLQGWENRADSCPWCDCDIATPNNGSYKLFGNPTTGISTPASVGSELVGTTSILDNSWATLSSMSTLSRHTSVSSTESESAQRHREMNERVQVYLTSRPHEILPSASKNYPTYSSGRECVDIGDVQVKKSTSLNVKRIRKGVKMLGWNVLKP